MLCFGMLLPLLFTVYFLFGSQLLCGVCLLFSSLLLSVVCYVCAPLHATIISGTHCKLTLNLLVLMAMMNTGMGAITVQKRIRPTTSQNT